MGLVPPLNSYNTRICLFAPIANIRLKLFQDMNYLHLLAQCFVHSRYLVNFFKLNIALNQDKCKENSLCKQNVYHKICK